jgi:hypothetical protein
MTLSITIKNATPSTYGRGIVMLSVLYAECHILALYAECHSAELHYAECRGAVLT